MARPASTPRPLRVQGANILDFMNDRNLLGRGFEGDSWSRWRAVLKAAFGLPMTDLDRELFNEVSGGRTPPTRRVRELVCCVGRGGGKDSIAAAVAIYIATTSDFSKLRPGERGTVMCLATDRDQAAISYNYAKGLLEESPLLAPLAEKMEADRIPLRTRAELKIVTNTIRAPRGRTIAGAIYDEIAFWTGENFTHPDVEVDAAVTPGLMRFPGSMKILISSVHRRSGLLYQKYAKHFGKDDDDVLVVLGTSLQFNPTLDEAEINRQLELDPEKASAEYRSIWRDDLSSFLDRVLVDAAIEQGVISRNYVAKHTYTMFVDPSGGRGDSFTAAIGHREGLTCVIDLLYEARAPFDSDAVIDGVAALAHGYNICTVYGDDYGADLTVAAFRRRRISYQRPKLTNTEGAQGKLNKSELYLNSLQLFTSGNVKLLDNPRLVHQLTSLERRAARSGHDTVDHPPGGHDDLANAVCGCAVLLAGQGGTIALSPTILSQLNARGDVRNRFGRIHGAKPRVAMGPPSWT